MIFKTCAGERLTINLQYVHYIKWCYNNKAYPGEMTSAIVHFPNEVIELDKNSAYILSRLTDTQRSDLPPAGWGFR